jgi:hypothetical protein
VIDILKHGIKYHLHLHPLTGSHTNPSDQHRESQEEVVIQNTPRKRKKKQQEVLAAVKTERPTALAT